MYPKLKYKAAEMKPGQTSTADAYAGFIYERVANEAEEAALGEGWHDSPRAAFDAAAPAGNTAASAPAPAAHAQEPERARPTEEWPLENDRAEKRRRKEK